MKSILSYKSQFHHQDKAEFGDDETLLSRSEFLDSIATRDKQYGT